MLQRLSTVLPLLVLTAACSSPLAPSQASAAPITAPVLTSTAKPLIVAVGDSTVDQHYPYAPAWAVIPARFPKEQWVNTGISGTMLHPDWLPGQGAFNAMQRAITAAGGTPVGFCVQLGTNDAWYYGPSSDAFFADLQRFTAGLEQFYPGAVIYLADIGPVTVHGPVIAQQVGPVRAAIERAWTEIPNVRRGPLFRDLTPDDGVHFLSPSNAAIIADRWTAILGRWLKV